MSGIVLISVNTVIIIDSIVITRAEDIWHEKVYIFLKTLISISSVAGQPLLSLTDNVKFELYGHNSRVEARITIR